jgi:hypothetical protein
VYETRRVTVPSKRLNAEGRRRKARLGKKTLSTFTYIYLHLVTFTYIYLPGVSGKKLKFGKLTTEIGGTTKVATKIGRRRDFGGHVSPI